MGFAAFDDVILNEMLRNLTLIDLKYQRFIEIEKDLWG